MGRFNFNLKYGLPVTMKKVTQNRSKFYLYKKETLDGSKQGHAKLLNFHDAKIRAGHGMKHGWKSSQAVFVLQKGLDYWLSWLVVA